MTSRQRTAAAPKTDRRAELVEKLADGIDQLSTTQAWSDYLTFQARFRSYSFGNARLIQLQRPDATLVTGYGAKDGSTGWLSKGRQVRTGEKAIWIWAPSTKKVEDPDAEDGHKRITYFRPVPVFDISQTDGDPIPAPVRLLEGEAPAGVLEAVVAFIESQGFTVQFVPFIDSQDGPNGRTQYSGRKVLIATSGRSTLQQAKTAIHEAGHVLLHEGSGLPRGHKELEAESVAFVAAQALGLNTEGYSFGYVLGWQGGDPAKARQGIKESAERIRKAVGQVIDYLEAKAAPATQGTVATAA
jgi:antirestriction protein ArdC